MNSADRGLRLAAAAFAVGGAISCGPRASRVSLDKVCVPEVSDHRNGESAADFVQDIAERRNGITTIDQMAQVLVDNGCNDRSIDLGERALRARGLERSSYDLDSAQFAIRQRREDFVQPGTPDPLPNRD